jgi:hypothetical protein
MLRRHSHHFRPEETLAIHQCGQGGHTGPADALQDGPRPPAEAFLQRRALTGIAAPPSTL